MFIDYYIKGLLIGSANIIPGISGGTLALILGIYHKIVSSSASIIKLKRVRENATFLIILSLGILTSVTILSKILKNYVLDGKTKEAYLNILFIGLTTGSIFTLKKETNNKSNHSKTITKYLLFLIGFLTTLSFVILRSYNISSYISEYHNKKSIKYYLAIANSGIIGGCAMILPGISGSLILLSLGTYKEIVNIISQVKIMPCLIFSLFTIIGTGSTILIIEKIINKHFTQFIYLSMGLILGSILQMLLIITKLNIKPNLTLVVLSCILFITGIYINKKLEDEKN